MDISNKAKVIYATMEKLGAVDNENKITSYAILDYIIEESEELQEHELLKDIPEDDYMNITCTISILTLFISKLSFNPICYYCKHLNSHIYYTPYFSLIQ